MSRVQAISNNIEEIQNEVGEKVTLVAVTKYSPIEDVLAAYEAGHRDFGENRVGDLLEKAQVFLDRGLTDVRWHMIGALQSNKVKALLEVPGLYAIHSVDRPKILKELSKRSKENPELKSLRIFFQVNTSAEDEKSGVSTYDELKEMIDLYFQMRPAKLSFDGLMTIGAIRTDNFEDDAKSCFKTLARYRELILSEINKVGKLELSMGMSADYPIAVSCGASFVRVGSKIFK